MSAVKDRPDDSEPRKVVQPTIEEAPEEKPAEPPAPAVPLQIVGRKLATANSESKNLVVFFFSDDVLTEEQRNELGEVVIDLKPSNKSVACGVLPAAGLRDFIVKKFPFIKHMETTTFLKEPV